ncbi:MAG: glycoside hydrolase family 26 protein [Lachnospiraceae bacterium]|nr:glycoside hydrolase family 26 protein [Lachnospiraceae bacterium]
MSVPVNKNATRNAKKLLDYLYEVAGQKIITGQHTQTKPMEEIDYIREVTGKEPKLRGFELLAYSPNINYDDASEPCLTEVYENRDTLETAYQWALSRRPEADGKDSREQKVSWEWMPDRDGIVTFCFHWFSPVGGRDKSFYTEHTEFDAGKVLEKGTPEHTAFFQDLDVIAEELKRFCDADIPILWRPFHESEGTWFWWGAKGPKVASELYKLMYRYYTEVYHLDNLLWVYNCPAEGGYPGDEYVDVISWDIYLQQYEETDYQDYYERLLELNTGNKVAALAEIGYLPDIRILEKSHTPWAYYMTWSKEFCLGEKYNKKDKLAETYESEYAVSMQPQ